MKVHVFQGNGEVTVYKGNLTLSFMVSRSNKNEWPTTPGGEVVAPRKTGSN